MFEYKVIAKGKLLPFLFGQKYGQLATFYQWSVVNWSVVILIDAVESKHNLLYLIRNPYPYMCSSMFGYAVCSVLPVPNILRVFVPMKAKTTLFTSSFTSFAAIGPIGEKRREKKKRKPVDSFRVNNPSVLWHAMDKG